MQRVHRLKVEDLWRRLRVVGNRINDLLEAEGRDFSVGANGSAKSSDGGSGPSLDFGICHGKLDLIGRQFAVLVGIPACEMRSYLIEEFALCLGLHGRNPEDAAVNHS